MKESTALKFSLALPLVIPALVAPLVFVFDSLPGRLQLPLMFILASGILGGVHYLVLVAILISWGRGKTDAQFKRALLLSPILMILLFVSYMIVSQVIPFIVFQVIPSGSPHEVAEVLQLPLLYVLFILGFGYSYVLLALGIVFVLKRLGVVTPSPTNLTKPCS